MDDPWLMQTLGAHQHTLQYLRWWFQAKIWIKICLKIAYFLKNFVKIRQALKVSPSDPSWLPANGGSAPRPPPPCDLTHTYNLLLQKRSKFVALFNKGFKGEILVKTFFWRTCFEHSDSFSPPPTLLFSYFYDSAISPSKKKFFFWENWLKAKVIRFEQIWLDLGKIKILHPQKHSIIYGYGQV